MRFYWKIPIISRLIFDIWLADARRKYHMVGHAIGGEDRLLEVGSGPGSILQVFREAGHDVTGLDIRDSAFDTGLSPLVYDGASMPFADNSFDIALILTTLHHTADPDAILAESGRVAKRLIIIEDVYQSRFQGFYTKLTDSITNMEFIGHPHSNRTDAAWCGAFQAQGWQLQYHKIHRLFRIYQQAVYVVDVTQ